MPDTLTQTTCNDTRMPVPPNVHVCAQRAPISQRGRSLLFFVGDFVFLTSATVAATVTMHMIHQLQWSFIPTSLFGMIAAMLVQTLMAFAAAPLLGSIECMVPSMIVGMLSPMVICVLHLFGCESTWAMAVAIGTAFAIGMFIFVQGYGRACRNALMSNRAPSGG